LRTVFSKNEQLFFKWYFAAHGMLIAQGRLSKQLSSRKALKLSKRGLNETVSFVMECRSAFFDL
jgi:hypothetical protein